MDKHEERYMWLAISVVIIGTFMSILDSSIVNVAIPKMMTIFGASTDQIEWVITGYMLTMSVIIPLTGYLGDKFGQKKLYVFALSTFTVGSLLCGFASSTETMIAARVVQAIGGGMIMPVGMSMILVLVPIEKRGTALGVWGIASMAAPAIGPTLSGYIVQYLDWRLIFNINIPVGIIGVTMAILMLKETPLKPSKKFDLGGALTSAMGLFTLLLALDKGNSEGWSSNYILILFTIAVISLGTFIYIELTVEEPLLELRLLKIYPFSFSLVISTITTIGMYGALFLMPIYIQNLRGYSPMQSGMLMLPSAIVTAIMMPISGKLFDKFGAKWVTIIGISIASVASFLLTKLSLSTPISDVSLIMMIRGIGLGLCTMPLQTAGINAIPKELSSRGTALNTTLRQVSGSFGIAVLTTILQQRQTFHTVRMTESLNLSSPMLAKVQGAISGLLLQHGMNPAAGKSLVFMQIYASMAKQAAVTAINDTFIVATLIILVGVPVAFFIPKKKGNTVVNKELDAKDIALEA